MTNDFDHLFDIAHLALAAKQWAEAAAGFERCVQLRPDFAPAWANLSIAYWRLGDTTRQLEAASSAAAAALDDLPGIGEVRSQNIGGNRLRRGRLLRQEAVGGVSGS